MCPMSKNEIFAIGNMVDWKSPIGSIGTGCGKGPFRVVSIEKVPTKCDCSVENYGLHIRGCLARKPNSVGHPQWVIVETKEGKVKFSGAYFKKVKK